MPSKNLDRIKSQDTILEEFALAHGNLYDYTKVVYLKGVIPVKIICKVHGEFLQKPSIHKKGKGCRLCGYEKVSKKITSSKEYFVNRANIVHNYKYDYTTTVYLKDNEKVELLCKVHGKFKIKANTHLNGVGCKKCGNLKISDSKTYSIQDFKKLCNKKHNNFYNYEYTNYTGSLNKVRIVCPTHGNFEQIAAHHLQGNGCQKCALESKGYGRNDFIKTAKGRDCTLYLLRCFNESEEFYKIGITSLSVEKRYSRKLSIPYNYEILSTVSGDAGHIWDLEKKNLRTFKNFKYLPKIKFKGFSECVKKENIKLKK